MTIGGNPYLLAISPDGTRVFVTNISNGFVSVIDTATNTVIDTNPLRGDAEHLRRLWSHSVVFSPGGSVAYVTNQSSHTVSVINTTTYAVVDTNPAIPGSQAITVGAYPYGLAVTPDFSRV